MISDAVNFGKPSRSGWSGSFAAMCNTVENAAIAQDSLLENCFKAEIKMFYHK
jgi:hypothetical protein